MNTSWRGRARSLGAALASVAAVALTTISTGSPAAGAVDEPIGWRDGANVYTQVINCPSQIFGNPYPEPGMAAKVGYYGDPDSALPWATRHYTYLHLVFAGLGNPCVGGTYFWPNVALPAGVEWYRSAPIECWWNGSPLTGDNCPQWDALLEGQGPSGSDAYVHPGDTTWHVSQGGIVELVFPIWAPQHAVTGANVQAWIHTADGNQDPTLTPRAPVWFFDPPAEVIPPTCQGKAVTVDLNKGQWPTFRSDVVLGTPSADTIRAGTGNDVVCGGGGNDVLRGGDGRDALVGGSGRDYLVGGAGFDRCFGGPGIDTARGCESLVWRPVAGQSSAPDVQRFPPSATRLTQVG